MTEAVNAEAVKEIAALAKHASGGTVLKISVPGEGLPDTIPVLFDHRQSGSGLTSLKRFIEEFRETPERKKGTARVNTLASFIDLTVRHMDKHSAIFAQASWPDPSLTAVLNYNEANDDAEGDARWGDHRVHYAFPVTDEFAAWAKQDGQTMSQADFAAFIEEHVFELADADSGERTQYEALFRTRFASPSQMVELSRGLQVFVSAIAKTNVTLQSGEGEITFAEEHMNHAGQKITVPGLFMVSMPAFLGGDPVRIPTRLRYRVSGGKIVWLFQMHLWKSVLRERVVADLALASSATKLPTYEGSPE